MKHSIIYISLLVIIIAYACGSGEKSTADSKKAPVVRVNIPDFSSDSAYAYIEKQLSFGPRVPGSPEHAQCAVWLEMTLRKFADTVEVQSFKAKAYNGMILRGKNIIASYRPESKKRILLSDHWDSRPYADHDPDKENHATAIDGANDGGHDQSGLP